MCPVSGAQRPLALANWDLLAHSQRALHWLGKAEEPCVRAGPSRLLHCRIRVLAWRWVPLPGPHLSMLFTGSA